MSIEKFSDENTKSHVPYAIVNYKGVQYIRTEVNDELIWQCHRKYYFDNTKPSMDELESTYWYVRNMIDREKKLKRLNEKSN